MLDSALNFQLTSIHFYLIKWHPSTICITGWRINPVEKGGHLEQKIAVFGKRWHSLLWGFLRIWLPKSKGFKAIFNYSILCFTSKHQHCKVVILRILTRFLAIFLLRSCYHIAESCKLLQRNSKKTARRQQENKNQLK